jgi:hypothetical protein
MEEKNKPYDITPEKQKGVKYLFNKIIMSDFYKPKCDYCNYLKAVGEAER